MPFLFVFFFFYESGSFIFLILDGIFWSFFTAEKNVFSFLLGPSISVQFLKKATSFHFFGLL